MLLDDVRLFRVNDHPLDQERPWAGHAPARFPSAAGAGA
jgi:hypothetical protein